MFIVEQLNGSMAEIELRDVDLLEEDFSSRDEVCKDVELYEMQNL